MPCSEKVLGALAFAVMSQAGRRSAALWSGGRSLADPQLSPDGQSLAFVTNSGDRSELVVMPASGGSEQWLPLDPPVKRISHSSGGIFAWLPDGSGLVYVAAPGGIYRYDFAAGCCRPLLERNDSPSALSVSPDGTFVAYVADMAEIGVLETSGDGNWPRRISSGADFTIDPVWSPDGRWLAWHEWDDPNMPWMTSRIAIRPADGSGPVRTVAGGDGIAVGQPRFSPDGNSLAFLSDESGWFNLWVMDVPAFGSARAVLAEEYEHGDPTWGSGQRSYCWTGPGKLVITRNVHGWGELVRKTEHGEARNLADGVFTGISASGNRVAAVVSDSRSGSAIAVLDEDADLRRVAHGGFSGLDKVTVEPEDVSWESDGYTIHGRLYRPRDTDGPTPLLVWIHGGPTSQSLATVTPRTGYFVERGWSVLVPDYRGSTGWGRDFTRALEGRWGKADVADVAAGITAAVDRGWAMPDQVVPYGGSAGGLTALLLMSQFGHLCAAGVVMYPVTDLFDLAASTWRFEAHYCDALVGPLPDDYDKYRRRSPLAAAEGVRRPLLLLVGDEDVVIPPSQSVRFAEAVRRAGGVVEHHVYEGEGHGWRKTATRVDELKRIETFLRSHVLHMSA